MILLTFRVAVLNFFGLFPIIITILCSFNNCEIKRKNSGILWVRNFSPGDGKRTYTTYTDRDAKGSVEKQNKTIYSQLHGEMRNMRYGYSKFIESSVGMG